ncbi:MAG: dockerin type I repeat-containing protein, partial [Prevotella sp.]|nr:dockerin type I repeat-containing protein [Prevotella sp.]
TSGIYSNFVLTQDNTGKCFVPTQGETIDAQKAYLRIRTTNLPSGGESRIALKFGNDLKGDANEDGKVDVADAVVTINKVLGQPASPFNLFNADINDDGIININDVVMTIKIILGE